MKKKTYFRGFTLIELLVVVAIIGLLASVILVSLGGARDSAKVATVVQQLRQMETAFQLYKTSGSGRSPHLSERSFGQGSNPTIDSLVENTDFSEFLPQAPRFPFGDLSYRYDNDGSNSESRCGGNDNPIFLVKGQVDAEIDIEILQEIDQTIDGEVDDNCGRFRGYSSRNPTYTLSGN